MPELKASGQSCPICGHAITVTPPDKEYIWCLNCAVLRTKYNYDGAQYGTNYALNYMEYTKSLVNTPLNLFRLGLISRWIKHDARILDIGCCVGEFIKFAEHHYHCVGFEPNVYAARTAQARVRSIILTTLNGTSRFECVTLFDVIEHIQEPQALLKHIFGILKPGGILALTTPNVGAITYTTKTFTTEGDLRLWKHYKPKEHLFLYSTLSIKRLLENAGFEISHIGYEESGIRPGNPHSDLLTCVARKK